MSNTTAKNTALRLKGILEVLAGPEAPEQKLTGNDVLIRVIERFPLNEQESELLSGGVPRGQKTLNSSSTKLVKAGWLVKGRGAWTVTEAGRAALASFSDAERFADALKGTGSAAAGKEEPALEAAVPEDAVLEEALAGDAPETAEEPDVEQPAAVSIAGSFNALLGAPADWQPDADQAQMALDQADGIWKLAVDLAPGRYEYKVALNRSWDENYGAFGAFNGGNIELHHDGGTATFHYDHRTRLVGTV
ncbi:glycosidase [Paenarthrobacter sp. DKR-5]|uniref:pullulanase X25 domain-containing protein n=1 Tax=Paenarthrobacter sp. DKR-5 TaxID=2835535 RepID=UPI001BDDC6BF|nr:winged helix-turn-helix domain-containing protein [Paenarthrobacter sp. DKR-5]MBT1003104.1 glycosidase [Paenarthrobacter sp. DKR-5]